MNDPSCPTRQIADIAQCAGVPKPYLAKIISSLSRKGLVFAKRGYHGGISLARPPRDISLLEVVEAVEGEHWMGNCLLGFDDCAKHFTCPTQVFWQRIRREITAELGRISLADVLAAKTAKQSLPRRSAKRQPAAAKHYSDTCLGFKRSAAFTPLQRSQGGTRSDRKRRPRAIGR